METIKKDIFKCKEDIICHQTNCLGVMGSGLAKQVKSKYPEVFNGYEYLCKTSLAKDLLGTALICEANNGKYIANLFGQINYGKVGQYTDYEALRSAFAELKDFAKEHNLSIAIPYKIGCGTGGGKWREVLKIINEIFADYSAVSIYKKEK